MTTTPPSRRDPLRVVLTRDVVESVHLVDAVISNVNGPTEIFGDVDAPTIPRSAIKFIQVIPLVRTGAADAYGCSDTELALGAASHSGEPQHTEAVAAWLDRIGFAEPTLECGPDRPIHEPSADQLLADGIPFGQLHNCCSGKHAGFLATAKHLGHDPAGYIEREHPVQALITEAIEQFTGLDLSDASSGADGCGIPTFSMPVQTLAVAMARFARPEGAVDAETAAIVRRLHGALLPNHQWIAGTDRTETELASQASEPVMLKAGAEGVFVGVLPDRGLGIACKARDGAYRAANTAIAALLAHLGVVPPEAAEEPTTNKAGTVVGRQYAEIR